MNRSIRTRFGPTRTRSASAIAGLLSAVVVAVAWTASAEPSIGDPAPDFALSGTDGTVHRLADSIGDRGVVLAWFPKAFTPG